MVKGLDGSPPCIPSLACSWRRSCCVLFELWHRRHLFISAEKPETNGPRERNKERPCVAPWQSFPTNIHRRIRMKWCWTTERPITWKSVALYPWAPLICIFGANGLPPHARNAANRGIRAYECSADKAPWCEMVYEISLVWGVVK